MNPNNDDKNGFEELGDRVANRADRAAGNLARSKHPVLKVIAGIIVLMVALWVVNIVEGFISFGEEAAHETKRVLSVKNIREQRTAIIEEWQDLLVAAGNACNAQSKPPNANSPVLVEEVAMAYAATAREARIEYNRRQNNMFEAEKVGPPGYPSTIPYSTEMDSASPNWCEISAKLHEVHE